MPNSFFAFKQFSIHQDRSAMKVTTDACLFGAWVANKTKNTSEEINDVLDIGTGTGLLSLMLAQVLVPKNNQISIDAVELDKDAAEQAKENMAASPWHKQLFVMPGDAKYMAYTFAKDYDVIISNPPFYETELESGNLQINQARHSAGLLLTELFTIIRDLLQPEGRFYLLLPYKRYEEVIELLREYDLTVSNLLLVKQSTKHGYFRMMLAGRKGTGGKGDPLTEEIAIWNDNQQYTPEFVALLKEFYLYL
jgi:tRNA1Val (adenine37-N6)-methyltransferase